MTLTPIAFALGYRRIRHAAGKLFSLHDELAWIAGSGTIVKGDFY